MVVVSPTTAEIGCSIGVGAGKPLNQCNFGCVIASGSVFDSRDGFLGPSYPTKTAVKIESLRDVAMATILGTKTYIKHYNPL